MPPVTHRNSLQQNNPQLSKEWHPTRNGVLTPSKVAPYSNKKYWWICDKGHEWQALVSNRNRHGHSCPYCGGRRVCDDNCLIAVNPELSKQWHPTKNGILTPEHVRPGSPKKVWWLCDRGHEWKAQIGSRSQGHGCPYCRGIRVTKENCLQTVNPGLAMQWHPDKNGNLSPTDATPNSHRMVWWVCSKGHEWNARISNRNSLKQGCPYCSGQRVCKDNCLHTINPVLSSQWHPTKNGSLTPRDVTSATNKKVWWICDKGHEWQASVSNRSCHGQGCPYCGGTRASRDNNLAISNPKVSQQWHPTRNGKLTPTDVTPNSSRKVWWLCNRNHEWKASIGKRNNGRGCPFCHSQTSAVELRIFTELKCLFENVEHRRKIDGLECDVFLPDYKVGIEVDSFYWHKDRQQGDREKTTLLKERGIDLIHVRGEGLSRISSNDLFFSERDEVEFDLIVNIVRQVSMLRDLEKDIKGRIESYIKQAIMMNNEEYLQLLERLPSPPESQSLAFMNPSVAREWHLTKNGNLTPIDVTPGSNKKVWWLCEKGHEWKAHIVSRNKGSDCPYCSGRKACDDNCLQNVNPNLAKDWHPIRNGDRTPKGFTAKSGKTVWWVCSKGHEWRAAISNRSNGTGCPYCSGNKVCEENCLQTVNPELAVQWHPDKNGNLTPIDVTPGSGKKVWWLCEKGHEWKAQILSRNRGNDCPYCSGRKVDKNNCLKALNPNLAIQWHPDKNGNLTPIDVTPGSNKKVWWLCEKGHEWKAQIGSRNSGGYGCPHCARLNRPRPIGKKANEMR